MSKFDELVNDYTLMGDDGAVIFSSYDQFLEFIEEIVVDERKREREACAKVCLEGTDMPVQVDALKITKAERKRISNAIRARSNHD
jgi:hypothetical protein